ncbi:MAG: hypothetical protein QME07_02020 [bacterium]|nr:hypothetical protein [bacterium]
MKILNFGKNLNLNIQKSLFFPFSLSLASMTRNPIYDRTALPYSFASTHLWPGQ